MGTSQNRIRSCSTSPTSSTQHSVVPMKITKTTNEDAEEEIILAELSSRIQPCEDDRRLVLKTQRRCSSTDSGETTTTTLPEITGREKLKRHRVEVAGQVWIPDIWGQENLLKDWIDCSTFDSSLAPTGFMSARAALIQEGARRSSSSCVKS